MKDKLRHVTRHDEGACDINRTGLHCLNSLVCSNGIWQGVGIDVPCGVTARDDGDAGIQVGCSVKVDLVAAAVTGLDWFVRCEDHVAVVCSCVCHVHIPAVPHLVSPCDGVHRCHGCDLLLEDHDDVAHNNHVPRRSRGINTELQTHKNRDRDGGWGKNTKKTYINKGNSGVSNSVERHAVSVVSLQVGVHVSAVPNPLAVHVLVSAPHKLTLRSTEVDGDGTRTEWR